MPPEIDTATLEKQHLIDPEICIRCTTCEATCPVGALADICRKGGLDWSRLKPEMRAQGRLHVETY